MLGDGYMIENDDVRRSVRRTGTVAECMAIMGGSLTAVGTTIGPDWLQVPGIVLIIFSFTTAVVGVCGAFIERRPISAWCGTCTRTLPHGHEIEYPGRDA